MYMVDSADPSKLEAAKQELHTLLEKPQLAGIPVLVLGNKNDLPKAMGVEDLIEALYVLADGLHNVCRLYWPRNALFSR